MPNPKTALEVLEAAKKAYKAKFTPGFYHSSAKPDIEAFDPNAKQNPWISHSYEKTPRGAVFVGRNPKFTESLIGKGISPENKLQEFQTGATTYPVSVNLGNHFDYDTPEGQALIREFKLSHPEFKYEALEKGSWDAIEKPAFLDFLKNQGYDTFSTKEVGFKNVGVFDPKNIRGKFAEYNPEHAESPDFMKAEGGPINPIKSPREMLLELVQFPHMAGGGEMKNLVEQAIKRYIQLYKKAPPPEDVKALEAHAAALAQKPTIWHDPVTQARARHELATNPGLINPEDTRDPFLTQAMTGRTTRGTRQAPFTVDITDPNLQKSLETKQMAGHLENLVGPEGVPSVTPATDALAKMSKSLEERALSSGRLPIIEQIKLSFFNKNKRQPTEDELNALIADYNPLRHQYGTLGSSIITSRPKTAKGMQDWRQKARAEGVEEANLVKRPYDYPNYLQAELDIAQGQTPALRPMADDLIKNPNREYADGRGVSAMTPREMQAMMLAHGAAPSKFEDPYLKAIEEARRKGSPLAGETRMEKMFRRANLPLGLMSAGIAAEKMSEGDPLAAALHGASAVGSGMAATRKYMKPGLGVIGAASVPLSIEEAVSRYNKGDRTGAVLSSLQAMANLGQMHPATAVPATAAGWGLTAIDAFRDAPQYKSVMESNQ